MRNQLLEVCFELQKSLKSELANETSIKIYIQINSKFKIQIARSLVAQQR